MQVNFRRGDADWITRRAWTDQANTSDWANFVTRASPRQLQLFGFPAPGHPYWNETTLADICQRYPGLDSTVWRERV
jgi:hypothetical protein